VRIWNVHVHSSQKGSRKQERNALRALVTHPFTDRNLLVMRLWTRSFLIQTCGSSCRTETARGFGCGIRLQEFRLLRRVLTMSAVRTVWQMLSGAATKVTLR
jgi:hypothetical protein